MRKTALVFFLSIFLFSCADKSSYFSVQPSVKELPPVKYLKPSGNIGENLNLKKPTSICLDGDKNIYIVDSGNDRLIKLDSLGNFLKEVGGFGSEKEQFIQPSYVAIDQGLNIYITDTYNRRIQRFDRNLNFISSIPPSPLKSELGLIAGIVVTKAGELYVSDTDNDQILKLDNFFALKNLVGDYSYGVGALSKPKGLASDSKENLYAADFEKNRIVVFDNFGNFLKEIKDPTLKNPNGVTVGQDGTIYVANTGNHNILIFNSSGEKLLEFGTWGKNLGQFSSPTDLKVFQDKFLYVADQGNNRICVFEIIR